MDARAFRAGARAAVAPSVASALMGLSFGVVAQEAGLSGLAAVVMSAVVFAGSAQFAAVAIIAQGGPVGAAVAAAALVNARFLPMGAALGPSLPGGPLRRAAQGQAILSTSWVMAARGDGTFDRSVLFGASAVQYLGWLGGTVAGVVGAGALSEPERLGLDVVYPAFFVAVLVAEVRSGRALGVAALGTTIALASVPFTPIGVPVLLAGLAALVGLSRSARVATAAAAARDR